MQKYRVLKAYPKQITNSGRLITLKKGASVYLKMEAQILRLIKLGFIKTIVEIPKKPAKPAKAAPNPTQENKQAEEVKKQSKSEWLNKKNKGE